jgi:hypothetical protein
MPGQIFGEGFKFLSVLRAKSTALDYEHTGHRIGQSRGDKQIHLADGIRRGIHQTGVDIKIVIRRFTRESGRGIDQKNEREGEDAIH